MEDLLAPARVTRRSMGLQVTQVITELYCVQLLTESEPLETSAFCVNKDESELEDENEDGDDEQEWEKTSL
ncbi:unnamed protein product [Angiostrongylus costaricensis]|uniref:Protein phosphatase 1 regulatory subunit 1B n=1 Tax=Angiostrongylus costaricensis TaxID=334426 RepID=A0A0R3PQ54_ANGCS|nr:unnamed protein product [Angiostrongylus costaricensis]